MAYKGRSVVPKIFAGALIAKSDARKPLIATKEAERLRKESARKKMWVWVDDHGIKDRLRKKFLLAYAIHGTISPACQAAGISNNTFYRWQRAGRAEDAKEADKKFLEALEEAKEISFDVMEDECRRRAVVGVLEPVYQGGSLVGHKRVYSDTLLIFRMKAKKPHEFRDNYNISHTGPGGAALPSPQINIQQNNLINSPERMNEILELARKFNLMPALMKDIPAPGAEEEIVTVEAKVVPNDSESTGD